MGRICFDPSGDRVRTLISPAGRESDKPLFLREPPHIFVPGGLAEDFATRTKQIIAAGGHSAVRWPHGIFPVLQGAKKVLLAQVKKDPAYNGYVDPMLFGTVEKVRGRGECLVATLCVRKSRASLGGPKPGMSLSLIQPVDAADQAFFQYVLSEGGVPQEPSPPIYSREEAQAVVARHLTSGPSGQG